MKLYNNKFIAEYIHLWGNSASLTLFDPGCKIFSTPAIEGFIGYRFELKSAIVFGDPVCKKEDIESLIRAFHRFCDNQGKKIVYVSVSEDFIKKISSHLGAIVGFGDEIILNPQIDLRASSGRKASMLRNKSNQSIRDGITVHEYKEYDNTLEVQMEEVGQAWINARKGAQIYLWDIDLFSNRLHKRWFYARHDNRIVAVLMLNKLDGLGGWALNILMVAPYAPHTTSEFLVLHVLDVLRTEGCSYFTIGTTPSAALGYLQGIGRCSAWLARNAYGLAKRIFKLSDRQRYWKKFYPQSKPLYLAFSSAGISMYDMFAVMKALNVGVKQSSNKYMRIVNQDE